MIPFPFVSVSKFVSMSEFIQQAELLGRWLTHSIIIQKMTILYVQLLTCSMWALSVCMSVCMCTSYHKYFLLQITKSLCHWWIQSWTTWVASTRRDHSWTYTSSLATTMKGYCMTAKTARVPFVWQQSLQQLAMCMYKHQQRQDPEESLKLCQREYHGRRAGIEMGAG